ncbi:MAG: hypothetical protein V3W02_05470, partial [Gammaproteobacteria bacterium]
MVMETVLLRFLARVIHADGIVDSKEVTTLIGIAGELAVPGAAAAVCSANGPIPIISRAC